MLTRRSSASLTLILTFALSLTMMTSSSSCTRTVQGSGLNPNVYAVGICNYFARCAPAYVRSQFGDVSTCASKLADESTRLFGARGTTITKEQLNACVVRTQSATCDDDIEALVECDFKGALVDGDPCSSGIQCATGSCFKAVVDGVSAECGVCSQRMAAAATCDAASCAPGLECAAGVCVVPGAVGAPCDNDTRRCRKNLACAQGSCVAPRGRDESCNTATAPCDSAQGLTCRTAGGDDNDSGAPPPSSGNCRAVLVKLGAPCDVYPFCETSFCSSTNPRTCTAFLLEGASCEQTSQCAFPLDCRAGKCVRSDPAACR